MKCAGGNKIEEKGEWLNDDFIGWKCSNCGAHVVLDIFAYGNYCPVCGHPMSSEKARSTLHAAYESLGKKKK